MITEFFIYGFTPRHVKAVAVERRYLLFPFTVNFSLVWRTFGRKLQNLEFKIPHSGGFMGKIKISSTNLLQICGCRLPPKLATILLSLGYFLSDVRQKWMDFVYYQTCGNFLL